MAHELVSVLDDVSKAPRSALGAAQSKVNYLSEQPDQLQVIVNCDAPFEFPR